MAVVVRVVRSCLVADSHGVEVAVAVADSHAGLVADSHAALVAAPSLQLDLLRVA